MSTEHAEDVRAGAVRTFEPADAAAWDELVARSVNGTLQHTRRFLAYHGDRFRDRSLLVTDNRGRLVGVFPAAEDPAAPALVTSHPGSTYGGLVHDGSLYGTAVIRVLNEIAGEYRAAGFERMRYRAVPYIYRSATAADDLYALFRLGASRYGCDLAAVIDLARRGRVRNLRNRSRKHAEAAGVRLSQDWGQIAGFWRILEMNLARRHEASPTHSLAEIEYLHGRFPEEIILVTAKIEDALVGGCVFVLAGPVLHMQYAATAVEGRASSAADLVLERGISVARQRGCRYFSFGTSTHGQGAELNEAQYWFKISFGGGGVTHEHYELVL
jgi:hypothetical protein